MSPETMCSYRSRLLGAARQMGVPKVDAEDLVQDTLLRALRSLHTYREGCPPINWLARIMHNTWLDTLRKRGRRVKEVLFSQIEAGGGYVDEPDPQADTESLVLTDLSGKVERAISRIDPANIDAFLLRAQGLSEAEVSRQLGIPIGTVKSRVFRAKKQAVGK